MLTDHAVQWIERTLAPSLATLDLDDPWYSPRRNPDMRGLAPALIISAGFDPIRDDGLDYAARLRADDVPVELLHYGGQFHGFLNFDSVNGASRDALQRIGAALKGAFAQLPAANRTIEIADRAPRRPSRLCASAEELVSTSLTTWTVTERWGTTLLRLLSPKASSAGRLLIKPWLAPALMLRGKAIAGLDRLAARQTWPACGAEPHALETSPQVEGTFDLLLEPAASTTTARPPRPPRTRRPRVEAAPAVRKPAAKGKAQRSKEDDSAT
jgi:acetyl esterase